MKILLVNEFSGLTTGYSVYGNELLTRFHRDGYEIAELATFAQSTGKNIEDCPWKVYSNLPGNDQENQIYCSNPQHSNGKWKFEQTCLDFRPNYVLDLRDSYMFEFESYSPFKQFYNWVIMATIDGVPQHAQWIEIYKQADKLISYTNWGKKLLESYGLDVFGVASPSASDEFFPIPIEESKKFKENMGINKKIVGTVMRNQPRKLFNELFEAFSKYVSINNDVLLYCHTTYPDIGWDLGELLIKHNILSKVLFTYKCYHCKEVYPAFFQDARSFCPFCKNPTSKMPDGKDPVNNEILNKIYNLFDCYVQLASREGFGMPQLEAHACNIPVINVPYAGMEDMRQSIGAKACDIKGYWMSHPMCMMEVMPDTSSLANLIDACLRNEKTDSQRQNIDWEDTYQVWKNAIDSIPVKEWKKPQLSNPPIFEEHTNVSNYNYAQWLVYNVLGGNNKYLIARITRDLNNGMTTGGLCGNYMIESVDMKHPQLFNRVEAYKICLHQRLFNNNWLSKL